MSKPGRDLRELLREIERSPDNVSLRISAAAAFRHEGRLGEAVAMYKAVVQAYVAAGRFEQAKVVARSALELQPSDAELRAVVDPTPVIRVLDNTVPVRDLPSMSHLGPSIEDQTPEPPDAPRRNSQYTPTPLPEPMPYHVAEPTRVSWADMQGSDTDPLEDSLVQTDPMLSERLPRARSTSGLSTAARKINEQLNAGARGLELRRASSSDGAAADDASTHRIARVVADDDERATRPVERVSTTDSEDEIEETPVRS